jgi:hypothetical protein
MSAQPKPLRLTAPTVSERIEQNVVVRWWEVYARTKALDPRLLFAIPNGAFLGSDRFKWPSSNSRGSGRECRI